MDITPLQEQVDDNIGAVEGEFGVYIRHLGSDDTVEVNGDKLYLLASVFKIPILIEALAQVDEGRLRLDERVELQHEYQLPTSMIFEHLQPGLQPTVRDLLTAMIIASDNTATDMVLNLVGIDNVGRRLQSWGISDISIRMSVEGLFTEGFRFPDSRKSMPELYREVTAERSLRDPLTGKMDEGFMAGLVRGPNWESVAAQLTIENNVATPRGIGNLLSPLVSGELLSAESTRLALDILLRQQLNQRLGRFLPRTAALAHKTGTFFASRNDAGILYLPDGSKAVIAVFAVIDRKLAAQDPLRSVPYIDSIDSAIGRIARSTLDYLSTQQG